MQLLRYVTLALIFLASSQLRAAELDEQLALLIPGTGLQESSGRLYAQQQLEALFARLEDQRIRRKNDRKMMSMLRAEVEGSFLQQHNPQADFHSLIKQGAYNQSTATALYALVLSYFQVPYELQIQATDLILIPHPTENRTALDIPTANPLSSDAAARFRQTYVELVRATNYLQPHEYNFTPDDIFRRYYMTEGVALSLKDAAAFMYYQQALLAFKAKRWSRSQDMLAQARRLSHQPMFEVLERATWLQLANQRGNSRESTYYLWKIWEEHPGQPWQDELIQRFDHLIKTLPAPTVWQIDSLYADFQQRFGAHEEAQLQLREHYFVMSARWQAEAGNTVQVLNLMDSLYTLRPNEPEVQHILASMFSWSLRKERNFEEGLKRIAYYHQHYPFLTNHAVFQDQHLFYRAEQVHHFFVQDDEATGLRHLQAFEELLQQTGPTPRMDSWVTTAYLAASNYYFRQESYSQARAYIDSALRHVPDDAYLLHRKYVLSRY